MRRLPGPVLFAAVMLVATIGLVTCVTPIQGHNDPSPAPSAATRFSSADQPWRVGTEIQPGRYRTVVPAGAGCYWQRLTDLSGRYDAIIEHAGPILPGRTVFVTIQPTDGAFRSVGCGIWNRT